MKSIFKGTCAAVLATTLIAGQAWAEGRPDPDKLKQRAAARLASVSTSGEVSSAASPANTPRVTPTVRATPASSESTTRSTTSASKRLKKQSDAWKNTRVFNTAFYNAAAERHASEIAALTQAFINLGPQVSPQEAARAARVVYTYVDQLVIEYQIEDSPLAHNTKVNMGIKPRGLCWHWAHDIDARLMRERFRTLQIHRAIANHDNIRLEHSTTMLGARGAPMSEAIVLDPWREGGKLFWKTAKQDTRYNWTEREEVFAYKAAMQKAREASNTKGDKKNRF